MNAAQAKKKIKEYGFRVVTERYPGGYGVDWILYDRDDRSISDGCTLAGTVTEALNDAAAAAEQIYLEGRLTSE